MEENLQFIALCTWCKKIEQSRQRNEVGVRAETGASDTDRYFLIKKSGR